jgi:hypothetical protein
VLLRVNEQKGPSGMSPPIEVFNNAFQSSIASRGAANTKSLIKVSNFSFGRSTEWAVFRSGKKVSVREKHPFEQAKRVRYTSHWVRSIDVEIEIVGDQWRDLWIAADTAVWAARDTHNRFIEDFIPDPTDPTVLILSTGS